MARQPQPWYWEARGAWYIQLDKKQIRLHEEKKQAYREFHRIMAARGQLEPRQRDRMTVADACEAIVAQAQHLRPATRLIYEQKLGLFAASQFRGRRLADVRPEEVIRWVTGTKWKRESSDGNGSRMLLFRYIKTLFKWSRDTGLVTVDPFSRVPNPWKVSPRPRSMTEDEYTLVMGRPRVSREFKEVLECIWRTGIRPGELSTLSRKHMSATLPMASFAPDEHKTGSKTGLPREVYFPADLWDRLRGYAAIRPDGPLLRRPNGKPWTAKRISERFGDLKLKLGIDCVIYQARHRFLSNLADGPTPLARVAKIAGHSQVDTLLRNYYHPEAATMAADVDAQADRDRAVLDDVSKAGEAAREAAKDRKRQLGAAWKARRRAELREGKAANPDPDTSPDA